MAADADTCGITSLCSTGRSDTAAHVHQPVQRHDPRRAPVVFAAIVLAAVCGLSVLLWDSFAPLAAAVCYWLAAWYAFRQLDGMSGDVSGFALTIAELGGAAVLVLWR